MIVYRRFISEQIETETVNAMSELWMQQDAMEIVRAIHDQSLVPEKVRGLWSRLAILLDVVAQQRATAR